MANTLTDVIPDLQEAANVVARELVGFIPACYRNVMAQRAAKDQNVEYPVVPIMSASDVTPSNVSSAGADLTITNGTIKMDKMRKVSWHWTGEQQRALNTGDRGQYGSIVKDVFIQGMRTLVNEIEDSLWKVSYKGASRGYGTAGTTPFGTAANLSDFAGVNRILNENGAPLMDRHLVLGHAAVEKLQGVQSSLFKVNEAGTAELLRQGSIAQVQGFMLHTSHPVAVHTKGTGSGYLINNASNEVVGETTITLDTGTGTILAGDVVTFAGTSHKYVVNTALTANNIVIGKPGLLVQETDNDTLTVGNDYTPNVAFYRNAVHLVMRAPDTGDDAAIDVVNVTDDKSGLIFQLARYPQYMQSSWELRVLYGTAAPNGQFIALLLG